MDDPLRDAKDRAFRTYDAAADCYDDEPLAFWSRIGAQTVARLELAPGMRVLDVGCGSGAAAIPAAEAVGPEGQVVGIDLSPRLVQLARAKAASRGLANAEFLVGDMTDSGEAAESFDAVLSIFSIFFVPDMEGLVAELLRLLRPGGLLAITTWGPRMFEPVYSRWNEAVRRERPPLATRFHPWDRIADAQSLRYLIAASGSVVDAAAVAEDSVQPLRMPEDWWTIARGSGLRWAIDQMGKEAAARVRDDNLRWIAAKKISAVETNAIYGVARKRA